jgi:hypothetical protein
MQAGVNPHQVVPPRPIDPNLDRIADRGPLRRITLKQMNNAVRGLAFSCVDNTKRAPIREAHLARIARLSTAHRIAHRPVEFDTSLAEGDHAGFAMLQIGVVTKQEQRRHDERSNEQEAETPR